MAQSESEFGFKMLALEIDDFAKNSYDCDVLINPNLGYSVYDYNGKIPEKSKEEFLILRVNVSISCW